jgi:hypothetical protein
MEDLSKFNNKTVILKNTNGKFLSLVPREDCENIDEESNQDDCINYIALLADAATDYSNMELSEIPYSEPKKFVLKSKSNQETLFSQRHDGKLCFDDGIDEVVQFELEERDNKQVIIIFKKEGEKLYVSNCDVNKKIVCVNKQLFNTINSRLCLSNLVEDAEMFTIEETNINNSSESKLDFETSEININFDDQDNASNGSEETNNLLKAEESVDNRDLEEFNANVKYMQDLDLYSITPSIMSNGMDSNSLCSGSETLEGYDAFAETTGNVDFNNF